MNPGRFTDPRLRHDLVSVPLSVAEDQVSDAGQVDGAQVESTTGMWQPVIRRADPRFGRDAEWLEQLLARVCRERDTGRRLHRGRQGDDPTAVVLPQGAR